MRARVCVCVVDLIKIIVISGAIVVMFQYESSDSNMHIRLSPLTLQQNLVEKKNGLLHNS